MARHYESTRDVARWVSRSGASYFDLLTDDEGTYFYDGSGMGGTLGTFPNDASAIRHCERILWTHPRVTRFIDLAQPDANKTPMKRVREG